MGEEQLAIEMERTPSQIEECSFEVRPDSKYPMFYVRADGWGKFFLNGYTIVPTEKYEEMQRRADAA